MRRFALVLMFCALALPVSAARAWVWPVDGPVLRPFSFDRSHPYAAGQHRGIDIGARTGTEVVAPAKGVVSFAGTVPTGAKTVSIQTPLGYTATLVHLGSIGVRQGALVAEGDVVGTVGPSGTPELSEPYVYFGVRLTADEQGYVDPFGLLPPARRPSRRACRSSRPPPRQVQPNVSIRRPNRWYPSRSRPPSRRTRGSSCVASIACRRSTLGRKSRCRCDGRSTSAGAPFPCIVSRRLKQLPTLRAERNGAVGMRAA